jgi:hypothetical protein
LLLTCKTERLSYAAGMTGRGARRSNMKPLAFALVGAIGLAAVSPLHADWLGDWLDTSTGLDVPHYGGPGLGGASYVANRGDPIVTEQPPYWGGPYWTICRGTDPPFQTYRIPPASCRSVAVLARRKHHHAAHARLK